MFVSYVKNAPGGSLGHTLDISNLPLPLHKLGEQHICAVCVTDGVGVALDVAVGVAVVVAVGVGVGVQQRQLDVSPEKFQIGGASH